MFQNTTFDPKYLLGWFPSSLLLSIPVMSHRGIGDILLYALALCFSGLVLLGINYGILSLKKQIPINWEIVWWCYPPLSMLNLFWSILRAVGRF